MRHGLERRDKAGHDTPPIIEEIREAVHSSRSDLLLGLGRNRQLIADVYAGREPQQFQPADWWLGRQSLTNMSAIGSGIPEATSNFLYATLQVLLAALFPATPSVRCEPVTGGAQRWAEAETKLIQYALRHAGTAEAVQRQAHLALVSGWSGLRVRMKNTGPMHERVRLVAVDPVACGWETFTRRFAWHVSLMQRADVPQAWLARFEGENQRAGRTEAEDRYEKSDADLYQVTEVFVRSFGKLNMQRVVFLACHPDRAVSGRGPAGGPAEEGYREDLGTFVWMDDLRSIPIHFVRFAESPNDSEDVPPAEVLSWMPALASLTLIRRKINNEVRNANAINLYDKSHVDPENIEEHLIGDSTQLWLPVTTSSKITEADPSFGVSNRVRPVERDQLIRDLVLAWQMEMSTWRELTGLGELQRGQFPEQFQTATTAQIVQSNSQLRNLFRRTQLARTLAAAAGTIAAEQRWIYGDSIEPPTGPGLEAIETITVPDPKLYPFAFHVDAVELGALAARGDTQALAIAFQTQMQLEMSPNAGAMSPIGRELAARYYMTLGIHDARALLPRAIVGDDPDRALREAVAEERPVSVRPDQDHAMHYAYFERVANEELAAGRGSSRVAQLAVDAMRRHRIYLNAREAERARTAPPTAPAPPAAPAAPTRPSASLDELFGTGVPMLTPTGPA